MLILTIIATVVILCAPFVAYVWLVSDGWAHLVNKD